MNNAIKAGSADNLRFIVCLLGLSAAKVRKNITDINCDQE